MGPGQRIAVGGPFNGEQKSILQYFGEAPPNRGALVEHQPNPRSLPVRVVNLYILSVSHVLSGGVLRHFDIYYLMYEIWEGWKARTFQNSMFWGWVR